MKAQKDIRTLCYNCKQNYISAGFNLISFGNKIKNNCDICNNKNGFDYEIQLKKQN